MKEEAKIEGLFVMALDQPLDNHTGCVVPVADWLSSWREDDFWPENYKHLLYIKACCYVSSLGILGNGWEGLLEPPSVGYDVSTDQEYFIFKMSNNGTTFIVSREPLSMRERLFDDWEAASLSIKREKVSP